MSALGIRIVAVVLLVAALIFGWNWLTGHYEGIGYEKRRAEDDAAMREQERKNRDLQRAAELRYTVTAEVRERVTTNTIKEVRYETANLAACVLSPAAVRRLRNAAECASGDSPAACAAGEPVRSP